MSTDKPAGDIAVMVTVPPYADFLEDVARHRLVTGFRLNTVMPLKDPIPQVLQRLSSFGKPLWVDLKGRQLRVVGGAIPPYTEIRVSHPIRVKTPVDAYFSDGMQSFRISAVDGDRLIMADGPRRLVGPGESVNIIDPSLEIEGTLTDTDRAYLAAMRDLGLKKVMLSYVEAPEDVTEVQQLLEGAEVILKIESQRGLRFVRRHGATCGQLMAARGDLYIEVVRPHLIIGALQHIIRADPNAVVASRILDSLVESPVPACADIGDVAFLFSLGFRTFMLGDAQCLRRDTVLEALNLLESIAGQMR
jgi:hypothetical protein